MIFAFAASWFFQMLIFVKNHANDVVSEVDLFSTKWSGIPLKVFKVDIGWRDEGLASWHPIILWTIPMTHPCDICIFTDPKIWLMFIR